MPSLRGENGIALPITIFVITLLTITLAASFARVDADRAVAVGSGDVVSALTVAQSGLQAYFGTTNTRPPDGDSVRFYPPTVSGGYADVVAHVVKKPLDPLAPWIYVVRSTGYVIVPELGAAHQAVRTMAQFAQWQTGLIRQFAAFTAANDMSDQSDVTINGNDLCADSAAAWSVRTRSASDMDDGTYLPSAAIQSGSDNWVADTAGVHWSLIVNGAFVPDYPSLVTGETLYKSHVIQGNATLNNASGTGLLAVTGDLTTMGVLARWEGIVLVGGEIFFNADSTAFLGMVITGLDADSSVGGSAPNARIGYNSDAVYIHYDSCRVGQTLAALTGFAPVRNAWVDTWPSY